MTETGQHMTPQQFNELIGQSQKLGVKQIGLEGPDFETGKHCLRLDILGQRRRGVDYDADFYFADGVRIQLIGIPEFFDPWDPKLNADDVAYLHAHGSKPKSPEQKAKDDPLPEEPIRRFEALLYVTGDSREEMMLRLRDEALGFWNRKASGGYGLQTEFKTFDNENATSTFDIDVERFRKPFLKQMEKKNEVINQLRLDCAHERARSEEITAAYCAELTCALNRLQRGPIEEEM